MDPLGIVGSFDIRYFYIFLVEAVTMRSNGIGRRGEIVPVIGVARRYFLPALEVLILLDRVL